MADILVVDDAPFMRRALSHILTKDGHKIVGEAENAHDAVVSYKKLRPDLVTLDMTMPEIDGVNSLKAIKNIVAEDKEAKIIVISAIGQQETLMECMQAGARDYVNKPFQPVWVRDAVRRALER